MSLTDGSLSAADVAAVTGNNGGFGNDWGGGSAWWLLVLFLMAEKGISNDDNCHLYKRKFERGTLK